ncbi:hypothetical protein ACGH2B_03155 [Streptomyces sp. BBFR2]|uniref:hypothetical protein n=1 Tax=Streptomyces sp. BBFR2 TaxID=3372854 RepID=UPI0037DA19E4
MPRETDWSALGLDSDPTPGDAAKIREVIASQQDLVDLADKIDDGLTEVKNTTDGAFVGKTGDALREVIDGKLRNFVSTFREAQEDVQSALRTYKAVMEEQQGRADAALQQAKELSEDDEDGRDSLKSTAKDAGDIQKEASATAASAVRAARDKIASPIDACDEIMKALSWLAIILIIPAIIFGGPVALFAVALNVAIFIKTAVDFANGDASALDLLLAGLGMIAPSTKGLNVMKALKGLRGLGAKGIGGIKTAFTSFKNVFTGRNILNMSFHLFFGTKDFARGAASWSRGLNGLWTHTPFSKIPGFGGRIFTGMNGSFHIVTPFKALPFMLPAGINGLHIAGALAYGGMKGIGNAAKWIGSGLVAGGKSVINGLSGFKALRLILPVDAAEIQALGIGKALRIGFIDRGVFGKYRFGAVGAGGRLLGGAGPINHLVGAGGGGIPSVHIDPIGDLAVMRTGNFAGPGSFSPSLSTHGVVTPPSMHFDGSMGGLSTPHLSMPSLQGMGEGLHGGISMPSIQGIGGGLHGGISMPSVQGIGGGLHGGISMPSLQGVGGLHGGLNLPSMQGLGGIDSSLGGLSNLGHSGMLGDLPTAGPVSHLSPQGGLSGVTAPGGVSGLGSHGLGSVAGGHFNFSGNLGDLGNISSGARIADVPALRSFDLPAPSTAAPHGSGAGLVDLGHVEAPGVPAAGTFDLHTGSLTPGSMPTVGHLDVPATGAHTPVSTPSVGRIDLPATGTAAPGVTAPGGVHLPATGSVTPGPVQGLVHTDVPGAAVNAGAGKIADVGAGRGLGSGVDVSGITPPTAVTHGITPPTVTTHGITPPASATHGITPPGTVTHGVDVPATGTTGVTPPATRGITPPAAGEHGITPPAVTPGAAAHGITPPPAAAAHTDVPVVGGPVRMPQGGAGGDLAGLGERAVPAPAPGRGFDGPGAVPGHPVETPATGAGAHPAVPEPKLPQTPGAGVPGHGVTALDGAHTPVVPHAAGGIDVPGAGAVRPATGHVPAPAAPHGRPDGVDLGGGSGAGGKGKGKAPDPFADWKNESLAKVDVFRKPGDLPGDLEARLGAWNRVQQARIDHQAAGAHLDAVGGRIDGPSSGPSVGEQALADFRATEKALGDAEDAFRVHGMDPHDVTRKLDALDAASLKERPRLLGGAAPSGPAQRELPGIEGAVVSAPRGQAPEILDAGALGDRLVVHGGAGDRQFSVQLLDAPGGSPVRTWHYQRGLGPLRITGEDFVLRGGVFDGNALTTVLKKAGPLQVDGHSWPVKIDGDEITIASPTGPQRYVNGVFQEGPPLPAPHTDPPPAAAGLTGDAAANWGKLVDLAHVHLGEAVGNKALDSMMRKVYGGGFTGKRGYGGFVDPEALGRGDLVGQSKDFHNLAQDLLLKGANERITVYRGVTMEPAAHADNTFVERLPVSTSNTFEFQPQWAKNGVVSNRVVFEIDVPADHGKIAMTYPPHYDHAGAGAPKPISDQWEITLSPTTLKRTGPNRIDPDSGLTIVPVRAEAISPDDFAKVIQEEWSGFPSSTAFDDFGKAFDPGTIGRWEGLEGAAARAELSGDGLVRTVTVTKPGHSGELTIGITHVPEKDSVRLTFTDGDGKLLADRTFDQQKFRGLGQDLRGDVLHNNEVLKPLPLPEGWHSTAPDDVPHSPGAGAGADALPGPAGGATGKLPEGTGALDVRTGGHGAPSRPSGAELDAIWARESDARLDVFRGQDASDDLVDARVGAWREIQRAQREFDQAEHTFNRDGIRTDGSSGGPAVGEQARIDLDAAANRLGHARDSFRQLGMDPDTVAHELRALDDLSLNERPRLLGGASAQNRFEKDLPGLDGVVLQAPRRQVPTLADAGAFGDRLVVHGGAADARIDVQLLDAPGGSPVRTWHYQRGFAGLTLTGEDIALRGGPLDGITVATTSKLGESTAAPVLDTAGGHAWPVKIEDGHITVASASGPQRYTWSDGAFHDAPPVPAPHTGTPPAASGLSGASAENWNSLIDVARLHLGRADTDGKVAALMRDVIGGSFTSKRGYGGFVIPSKLEDGALVAKVEDFHRVTQDLLFEGPNKELTVYRGVSMEPSAQTADVFTERLPISTSNTFDFQPEWAKNGVVSNRVVFEIQVPADHGKLAMAYPPHFDHTGNPAPRSPDQWEITLSPTKLVRTGATRTDPGSGLTIVPVRAEAISPDDFAKVIQEEWPGLPSGTAFDDFGKAFDQSSIVRWRGFEDVTVRPSDSADGLVKTFTVTKPGSPDRLTITVTHHPGDNSVEVAFTGPGGEKLLGKSWSGTGFTHIAADLRGGVLHNAEEFSSLPKPGSWDTPHTPASGVDDLTASTGGLRVGDAPASGLSAKATGKLPEGSVPAPHGSRPTGAELERIHAQESAARLDVFRRPGDSDGVVNARLDAWGEVVRAQRQVDHAQVRLDAEGGSGAGGSDGLTVGDHARISHAEAVARLDLARDAFRAHGMDPDVVGARLDELTADSLKERPRLLGGSGDELGPHQQPLPFGNGTVVEAPRGGAPQFRGGDDADGLLVMRAEDFGPRNKVFHVDMLDAPGGATVRTWHYKVGLGNRLTLSGEDVVLRGGALDDVTITTRADLDKRHAAPMADPNGGHSWPVKVEDGHIVVASPSGPQRYLWSNGAFHDAPPVPAPRTDTPPASAGLDGKAAENWNALVDVGHRHLGRAAGDSKISALMTDVRSGSAFTSKRGYGGFLKPGAADDKLLNNVRYFHQVTQDLLFEGANKDITVYRGVSMDPASQSANDFMERLPISTSNNFEFQHEWAKGLELSNRAVFEIHVPAGHGKLAMAYPPHFDHVATGSPVPRSPDQWEITLPPTKLVRTGPTRVEGGLNVVPVRAEAISPDDFAKVIKEEWPGLPSGTAFDDFGKAFDQSSIVRWKGFDDVTVHPSTSEDGLVKTFTVTKPGSPDHLTITVTHQPGDNRVGIAFADSDGLLATPKSWSGTDFRNIAADLRGGVLHNADEFTNLPKPGSWEEPHTPAGGAVDDLTVSTGDLRVGDAPASGLGAKAAGKLPEGSVPAPHSSRLTGAELEKIHARESAARLDVFRRPGDSDGIVNARAEAWGEVQLARNDLADARARVESEGGRVDGPSRGLDVGERARAELHLAQTRLDEAREAFRAHGMDPDAVGARMDELTADSLKERPRLLGGSGRPGRASGEWHEMRELELELAHFRATRARLDTPPADLPPAHTPGARPTPPPPVDDVAATHGAPPPAAAGTGGTGAVQLHSPEGLSHFRQVVHTPDGPVLRFTGANGAPVPGARVEAYGEHLRVSTPQMHQVFATDGTHLHDLVELTGADGLTYFAHRPLTRHGGTTPLPSGELHRADGVPVDGTEVTVHGEGFRSTSGTTVHVFDSSGTFEFRALRLPDAPGATGQLLRTYEHGALEVLGDGTRAEGFTAHTRPGGGFRIEDGDGGFRLVGEDGTATHVVTVEGSTFHVADGAGSHLYDAVRLADAPDGRFLRTGSDELLDANLEGTGVRVTREDGGGFRTDGTGPLRQGEFTRYRADGSLEKMRINVIHHGTPRPGHHFEVDFPAKPADGTDAAKATWKRVTPGATERPDATAKWFDSGTVGEKGIAGGRVQLLSHSGAEVFERRPLPGGGFLDAQRPTASTGFARFGHQRSDWQEIAADGSAGRHGKRHFGTSGRSWYDMDGATRVRHWRENPDGGHVLAQLDRDPLTQGLTNRPTTWHRYDEEYTHLAQGERTWSPGRGWTDTMTDTRTGLTETVHERFGRLHADDNRRYFQREMEADGSLKKDWISHSAHGKENAAGKTLKDGGFLQTHRVMEQRPPSWVRNLLSSVEHRTFAGKPWLTADNGFQVHTWKYTPAGAEAPATTGVRLVGRDSSTLDIASDGTVVRATTTLSDGSKLTVGDVEMPAGATRQDGYLPWSAGDDGLKGHRTFHPDDFTGGGDRGHGDLVWQDRHRPGAGEGDWFTPGDGEWRVAREGFADGTVVEYRTPPRAAGGDTVHAGPGDDWVRTNQHGEVVARRDTWPGGDGGAGIEVTATGRPGAARVTWEAGGESGVRVQSAGGGTGRYWDNASYQDFDSAGRLVRDHRVLDDGTTVDAWRVAGGEGEPPVWHWNKTDKEGHILEFGDGAGRVRTWTDARGNALDDWREGALWRDHSGGDLVQEIPPVPRSGSLFQDHFSDPSLRVREHRATPDAEYKPGEWREFDNGAVVRTRTALDDGTFLESDEWNKQWRRYGGADGTTLLSERTMAGYVWEKDSFGRMTLVGRENDFRGWAAEFRGGSRMMREPNRFEWSKNVNGESLYTPFVQKAANQALVEFIQEFTLDFTVGLIVNAIAAEISGREFSWTDVAKAAFGAAVGSTVKIGVSGLHNAAGRGGTVKTGMSNVDSGKPYARPPASDDTWSTEWAGNEKVTRWRAGTYDFSVGISSGLVSGFITGAASSAIFGVYDSNGNVVHLSGTDALREGALGMASGLAGGLSFGAAKTVLQQTAAGRFYHRQGLVDLFLVGGISKFADKMFGGLILTPELRKADPPWWQQQPAPEPSEDDPHDPQESTS